jgi:GntR family transcriptional regulator/MocR family aminotransferase
MQALAPAQITYAGTASKSLAPALRLAWLVVPARLVASLRDLATVRGSSAAVLDQLVLADLIDSGAYDRHVRRMRNRYRARRNAVVDAVAPHGLTPAGIAAGLHMLLPTGDVDERAVTAAARRHGVGVDLLGRYRMEDPQQAGMLVGYAAPAEHAFPAARDALAAMLAGLRR